MKILMLAAYLSGAFEQQPDSLAAAKNFDLFKKTQYEQTDSAVWYINQAISLADKPALKGYHAALILEKGKFLRIKGRFKEAVNTLDSAAVAYAALVDSTGLAEAYTQLGVAYWRWVNSEKVMDYYMKSLAINKAKKSIKGQTRNYMVIGTYYAQEAPRTSSRQEKNKFFQQGLDHYNRALDLLSREPNPLSRAQALQNSGNIYGDTSFVGYDFNKALQYFNMSLVEYENLKDSASIAGLETSIGFAFAGGQQLDSAQVYNFKALHLSEKLHLNAFIAEPLINLGNIYFARKQFIKAKEKYLESLHYARQNDDLYKISSAYHCLARVNWELKQYENAYQYLDSAASKLSIINEKETMKQKMNSEVKYDVSRKESELKLTESELKVKTVQRDGIMIVLIVALSLSIIIVLLTQQRQKALRQLREKEETLYRQQVDDLLKKQEIASLVAYLNGQEEERKRIAEDLHDRLGSTLSATKLYLNATGSESVQPHLKANQLLDQAVEEVREISHNLLSGTLSKFGLTLALEELKNTVSNTNQLKMSVFVHGVERLPASTEISIYRIIQELVSNILKHATAKEITIQLNRHPKELTLTVEDDGIGFDNGKQNAKSGIGLMNVESRITALHGSLYIDSGKGNGTTITVNIPLAH